MVDVTGCWGEGFVGGGRSSDFALKDREGRKACEGGFSLIGVVAIVFRVVAVVGLPSVGSLPILRRPKGGLGSCAALRDVRVKFFQGRFGAFDEGLDVNDFSCTFVQPLGQILNTVFCIFKSLLCFFVVLSVLTALEFSGFGRSSCVAFLKFGLPRGMLVIEITGDFGEMVGSALKAFFQSGHGMGCGKVVECMLGRRVEVVSERFVRWESRGS